MELFEEIVDDHYISEFDQFRILLDRMWLQMWKNKKHLVLKVVVYILIALVIGNICIGVAADASKGFFNFGFYYICVIFFMYIPMMPVLLSCEYNIMQ